jgi:hypothetical protein
MPEEGYEPPKAAVIGEHRVEMLATEAWTAVLAGLIPIVGLVGVGYVIVRAVRDSDEDGGN